MKVKKKILFPILIMTLILNSFSFICIAAKENYDETSNLINEMLAFSIYYPEDGMQYTDETVTRECLADILSRFSVGRMTEHSSQNSEFEDIPREYWAAGAIKVSIDLGYMDLYSDGLFRPKTDATIAQAIKAAVVISGYSLNAEQHGGWPTGYLYYANHKGLLRGVTIGESGVDEKLTKGILTQILHNLLFVKPLVQTAYGDRNIYEVSKETVLKHRFNICEVEDVVNATDDVALLGYSIIGDGMVQLGDKLYTTKLSMYDYIGLNVKAYYYDDKYANPELIYIIPSDNKVLKIDAGDIDKVNTVSNGIYYFEENKLQTADIASDANIIYNGVLKPFDQLDLLMPDYGNVVLIDSDRDDIFETVIIRNIVNYLVSKVYVDDISNTLRIIDDSDFMLNVDLSEFNNFISNGTHVDYTEIRPKSVISVISSDISNGQISEIIICNNKFDSIISSIRITNSTATLGDETYEIADLYDYSKYPLSVGSLMTIYMDGLGRIAFADNAKDYIYAFIVGVDEGNGLDDNVQIKVYTENGNFEIYKLKDKVIIDGVSYKKTDAISVLKNSYNVYLNYTQHTFKDAKGVEQLVRMYVGGDNITKIDTVAPGGSGADTLTYDTTYTPTTNQKIPCSTYRSVMILGDLDDRNALNRCVDENVIRFVLPDNVNEKKGYNINNVAHSSPSLSTPFSLFDTDSDGYTKVIVEHGAGELIEVSASEINNLMVVNNIEKVLMNDETVTVLEGYRIRSGAAVILPIDDDSLIDGMNIVCGDVVSWNQNSAGYAKLVRKVFSYKNDDGTVIKSTSNWPKRNVQDRLMYAMVINKTDKFWQLKPICSNEGTTEYESHEKLRNIFRYTTCRGEPVVEKGSIDDVRPANNFGELNATRVFVYSYDTVNYSAVLYN